MKRILLTAAMAILLSAGAASAQDGGSTGFDPQNWFKQACPSCGVRGYVDLPQPGATIVRSQMVISGWAFECVSGRAADRVQLFYEDESGTFRPLKQDDSAFAPNSVFRPDVALAYAGVCAGVHQWTGWWMRVTDAPPAGARRVKFQMWSGPYHAEVMRTYSFVD
jgi:hypothetical protein